MIAIMPSAKPSATYPTTAAAVAITIVARSASRRSAARVASGMARTRTIMGTASTMPIALALSPLAASQTGRNGSCTPSVTNSAAKKVASRRAKARLVNFWGLPDIKPIAVADCDSWIAILRRSC